MASFDDVHGKYVPVVSQAPCSFFPEIIMRMPSAGFMASFDNIQRGMPILSLAPCSFFPGVSCECGAGGGRAIEDYV